MWDIEHTFHLIYHYYELLHSILSSVLRVFAKSFVFLSISRFGASDGEFKSRYNNHTNSLRHRHHEQDTELSKQIWKLQNKGINFKVKWSVAAYASTYRCGSRRCDLCLTEKYVIARANHKNLLNKRTELISKCRHKNKYILKNIK